MERSLHKACAEPQRLYAARYYDAEAYVPSPKGAGLSALRCLERRPLKMGSFGK